MSTLRKMYNQYKNPYINGQLRPNFELNIVFYMNHLLRVWVTFHAAKICILITLCLRKHGFSRFIVVEITIVFSLWFWGIVFFFSLFFISLQIPCAKRFWDHSSLISYLQSVNFYCTETSVLTEIQTIWGHLH